MSKELEKIGSGDDSNDPFPEHSFYASCLRTGLTINDLKIFTYVDIMKILLSFISDIKNNEVSKATQADIDKLLG